MANMLCGVLEEEKARSMFVFSFGMGIAAFDVIVGRHLASYKGVATYKYDG